MGVALKTRASLQGQREVGKQKERKREREGEKGALNGKCSYVYQKILQGKFGLIICKVLYPIKVIVKFDHNFSVVSNLGRLYSELLFFWGDFINQIP